MGQVRPGLWAAALAALLASPSGAAPAAPAEAKPKKPVRVLPGEPVELKTKDGWTLSAQHSPAQLGQKTFILLHEAGGRKENWYTLARAMARKGYGVLGLDLRGHGASRNPPAGSPAVWNKFRISKDYNEWNNMSADVEAAVAHLTGRGVDESYIAFGGADVGGSIALRYAAVHKQVPQIFLLSPGMSYREVLTVNAMRNFGKRPVLMVVGSDDARSTRESAILSHFAKIHAGEENATLLTVDREHGTKMLGANKGLVAGILDWIETPVKVPAPPEVSTAAAPSLPGGSTEAAPGPPALPTDEQIDSELNSPLDRR